MLLRWDVVEPYQISKDKQKIWNIYVYLLNTLYLVLPSYNTFNLFTLLSLWQSNSDVYSYVYSYSVVQYF